MTLFLHRKHRLVFIMLSVCFLAAESDAEAVRKDQLQVTDASSPYVVKKGDTLWDIADYFFKEPKKWVSIWEKNNQITNPHLIYPGDQVWLNGKGEMVINQKPVVASRAVAKVSETVVLPMPEVKKEHVEWEAAPAVPSPYQHQVSSDAPHLKVIRMQPEIKIKPVERLEKAIGSEKVLTALQHQDFVQMGELQGVGYIVNSNDDRLYYSLGDILYIHLDMEHDVYRGDIFNVFRRDAFIKHPTSDEPLGSIIEHLGQLKILSKDGDMYRASVVQTFTEFADGDRLRPAREMNHKITLTYPTERVQGHIVYMRNAIAEVGKDHVVAIDLGIRHGLVAGSVLSIHRLGRVVKDPLGDADRTLPEEKIGEMIVLAVQSHASMAIITKSSRSISFQDVIRAQAGH